MHVFTFTCCVASFLPVLKYHKVNWDFFPQLETFVLSYIHNGALFGDAALWMLARPAVLIIFDPH